MDNQEFLNVVGNSFKKFLETGSRSNEKLKILHGAIANDLKKEAGWQLFNTVSWNREWQGDEN